MWLGSETNCSPDLARLPDQPQTSLGSLSCSFARAHCIRIEIVIKIWIEIGIGMFMTWSVGWAGSRQTCVVWKAVGATATVMSCRRNRSIWQGVPYPTYAGRSSDSPISPRPTSDQTTSLSLRPPGGRTRAPGIWSPRSEPEPRDPLGSRRRGRCRGPRCTTARITRNTCGNIASSPGSR